MAADRTDEEMISYPGQKAARKEIGQATEPIGRQPEKKTGDRKERSPADEARKQGDDVPPSRDPAGRT